ncbi:hypothetical protein [Methylobacterium gregans]|uniref:Anti-sigma factor NepR domain-containing protein n=1 Tax=Methylobacterium gregans TaxID=374424 RepID=A0AA37HTT7_9HYPH|nr:hypothetical protein [Methylobacterium gregans]MDQ0523998.1 hypothetical protein [Methylobacterium gregans]GJD81803.1 hypothetical protein NBEOAGPD_5057 [Methylobacterium gregans]GLS56910.1 hypothetical protein GCM10007886_50960 [Methylobacterium gregans]
MKIVSENYAARLARTDDVDSTERLMLDAISCDLRSLFGDEAADLPDHLLILVGRLEALPPPSDVRAA